MIKIGNKPIIEHQIDVLNKYGIKDVIILTHYMSDIIERHFKDNKKVKIFKEEIPLGTSGGIKEIENILTDDFLLIYGDVMFNMNLERLIQFHKKKKSVCTLVVRSTDHPIDSDLIDIDDKKRIKRIYTKPHDQNRYYRNLAFTGICVMSKKILKHIKRGVKADLGHDIFPNLVDKERLYAYKSAEYIKDIGTPERLDAVQMDQSSGKIIRLNIKNKRKAIFLDRDGTIGGKKDFVYKLEDFNLLPGVAEAIKKINDSEFLAIVVTNQPVVARGLCTIEELEEIHKKMETLLGEEGVKLDEIYYCPHHPDKGYPEENSKYKIICDCRKPKTGMIEQAVKDFNIDLKKSFIIGDSDRDILCGKNAGVRTIALNKTLETPDYRFNNLKEAIDFIIEESR